MALARSEDLFQRIKLGGLEAIDQMIAVATSEELFLDFKRSGTPVVASKLGENDRSNLAKAISGFGNSEGGVIVWGLDCRPDANGADVVGERHPIQNPQRFRSWLEGAVGGLTVPPHGKVEHIVVLVSDETGFVITHVPKSDHAPHQTVKDSRYFIRSGSNFLPTPHAVLSGMFGRRPQPRVWHSFLAGSPEPLGSNGIKWDLGVFLHNGGAGIASFPFMNLMVYETPSDKTEISFDPPNQSTWAGTFSFGRKMNLIAKPDIRLAPGAEIPGIIMRIALYPPYKSGLRLAGQCGADGSETFPIEIKASQQTIDDATTQFLHNRANGVPSSEARRAFQDALLRDMNDRERASP